MIYNWQEKQVGVGTICVCVYTLLVKVLVFIIWVFSDTKGYCPLSVVYREEARGRLGRNSRPKGQNFAPNGSQEEVRVSLKKKRLIFILSPQRPKLW